MSVDLIAAFNAAETWQDALAAVKDTAYFEVLFEDPEVRAVYSEKLADLPDDQGREQAIGMGIVQIKALFGDFTSVEDIAKAVKGQIDTEHAKFEFITALDAATTAAEMAAAIEATAGLVNEHRQALIDDFLASDDADVVALGNLLKTTTFTKALAEIVKHLDDEDYMAEVGELMLAARNASVPDGRFYGDGKATAALDSTMDAIDPVYAFNSATTASEILAAITVHGADLLDDASEAEYAYIPSPSGRQTAVADGILEIKKFFGEFASEADLIKAVDHQVSVEYNKQVFIDDVNAARGENAAADLAEVLLAQVDILNGQRQALIAEWGAVQNNAPLAERVAELKADSYTIILKALDARLDDADADAFLAELTAKFVTDRGDASYFGVWTLLNELDKAGDAIDPVYASNSAATTDDMVKAIKDNYVALLDDTSEDEFEFIPDGSGRQKAVANGVLEIKKFFGEFASEADLIKAVDHQVSVEYNKYVFIQAIDNAADAAGIAAALVEYVGTLNDQRQDLIAEWGAVEGNAALAARVAELRADIYTKALKAVADRLGNEAFVTELAESLFEARSDVSGGRFNSIVTITNLMDVGVEMINVDPTAPATQAISTNEDTSTAALEIDAADLDGDTLTYSVKDTAMPQKGTVTFDQANGTFTYEPDADVNGTDTFTIVISDGQGGTVEQVVNVTVNPVNDAPEATTPTAVSTNEDTATTVNIGAVDWEGDDLTYSVKDSAMPQKGTVTFDQENGKFTYVPNADVNGADTFTIVISDGKGGTAEQVVWVTINPVNDAPVAASTGNSASGNEDTVITGSLPFGVDVDADDTMKYELVAPLAGLTLNPNGTFSYAPPADFNGVVEFKYRVVDTAGAKSEAQTFKLTVNAVNDAPRDIILSNASVLENSATGTEIGKLTAADPEGGDLTFTLLDNAGGRFVLDATTNTLKVASNFALDYEQAQSHTVRVQVKDAAGATYEETLTINVGDVSGEKVTGTSTSDVLTGNAGNDVFNAGAGNDSVSGGAGNDKLYGGSGNDKIRGGIGKDTLKGEAGKDTFVFDTTPGKSNVDKVLDFNVKDDSFWLDNAVFTKLGKKGTEASPAKLSKSFFTIGDKAKDKNDYVIYDDKKGKLFYDADGSGKGKQVEIATLSKNLKLTEKDFFIV